MPFKSQAQRRKFAQLLVEGKISPDTYEEWNRETGGAKLPERVNRSSAAKRTTTNTPTAQRRAAKRTTTKQKPTSPRRAARRPGAKKTTRPAAKKRSPASPRSAARKR